MERIGAAFGADAGAAAGGAHALSFHVAGGGGDFANGSFTDAEPTASAPGLIRWIELGGCPGGGIGSARAGAGGRCRRRGACLRRRP